ncbi:ammonia-dependent NAD(+) synthetase [Brochothrix thermosphacta]|uniref:ammonia-dependent NAD(+) synthetase n=1 Tax=Brochothrix thermosphacta TaxID=2756 RepID=UPI0003E8C245|nr:ammonia-dependent NAD(+) synthetase [Brochothrix thermosphacta]ANZ95985.1 NAD(+) synthase [Brochothrix thermosphacta]EUJ37952.1 NAD synthetase [Brochothrix thermosphacta DSM 20171 = FSL F6-1036]ODJ48104.1 NAD(+) synthase [Brochothrix thermosphacta DSM 20171 = FSL F6-1036]ODJ52040.1 NAD(+) synthase [Brochothrix thermosphacta]ODJ53292.1 NAD(+) synthase [Brochothrix thermosphacta]
MSLQTKIIAEMGVKPTINAEEEIRVSVDFLKAYLVKHSFLKTLVIAVSGGQDSTLAGRIAQIAVSELREETQADVHLLAVRLPYGVQLDEADAQDALAFIGADELFTVNIKASVDATQAALAEAGVVLTDFVKGNIKARERMVTQYGIAGARAGAVIGTDHAAEAITGFYTKYGDGGTDINPLFRLNKRQGRQLLEALGAPEHLYTKIPTADLEEDRPALSDEVALGVTYDEIDDYLEGKTVSAEAETKIESWYLKSEHKRHLPITVFDDFWKK